MLDSVAAPSPFLPNSNLQFAWDSTSIGYLKTCPRLYQYIMVEGWSSPDSSVHLEFGKEIHTAFQDYEILKAQGVSHEDALRSVVRTAHLNSKDWNFPVTNHKVEKAVKYKNRNSLLRTIVLYLDHYRADQAKQYILANGKPAVELSFQFDLETHAAEGQPYKLCGHLDRVVDYHGDLYVIDYKTTQSSISDYWFQQFDPNNQMSLYSIASKVVLDSYVKGVIIEGIQLLIDDSRFSRGITYRPVDRMEEWLRDLDLFFAQAELYAEQEYWPQNDTACDKFGGCQFRTICGSSPSNRKKMLEKNFVKLAEDDRWNPLKAR